MFGLSIKEVLTDAILNASRNLIDIYKQGIRNHLDSISKNTKEENQVLHSSIRRDYLDRVTDNVINSFNISSPSTAARAQLALISPSLCGYEDIDIDKGVSAGALYAICYYAIKDKIANPRDCIILNHLQGDILNNALFELDQELSKDYSFLNL